MQPIKQVIQQHGKNAKEKKIRYALDIHIDLYIYCLFPSYVDHFIHMSVYILYILIKKLNRLPLFPPISSNYHK